MTQISLPQKQKQGRPLKQNMICSLVNLKQQNQMNGKLCQIMENFDKNEQRYLVYVFDTKDMVYIKEENLQIFENEYKLILSNLINKFNFSNGNQIIDSKNMSSLFANRIMKSACNQVNSQLLNDFHKMINGNCIYLPSFFCHSNDYQILHALKYDLLTHNNNNNNVNDKNGKNNATDTNSNNNSNDNDNSNNNDNNIQYNGMISWSQHLKHENPAFSLIFNNICSTISNYFECEIYATRLNYYRDGNDYKPFHHDSHAYSKNHKMKEDFTIGVSFGTCRDLQFLHVKTNEIITIPQKNGDIFAFNSIINDNFKHGVPKVKNNKFQTGERFSIIMWGKRKYLNEYNSGVNERNKTLNK